MSDSSDKDVLTPEELREIDNELNNEDGDPCSSDMPTRCSVKLESVLNEIPHQCKICGRTFDQLSSYETHIGSHTEADTSKRKVKNSPNRASATKNHVCDLCEKKFTSKLSLIRHIGIHSGDKFYNCTVCRKRFASAAALASHQGIHTRDKLYSCDICHKRFSVQHALNNHKRIHTKEGIHRCKTCNKEFMYKTFLKLHERIHTGEKPHSCGVCGKKFMRKSGLTVHERLVHNKTKHCPICKMYFTLKSELLKHQIKFQGQQPYTCKICNIKFCSKRRFLSHRQDHLERVFSYNTIKSQNVVVNTYKRIEKAMFSCDICNKQFTKQSSLTQHVELLHSLIVKVESK